jgi:hypothetical protein
MFDVEDLPDPRPPRRDLPLLGLDRSTVGRAVVHSGDRFVDILDMPTADRAVLIEVIQGMSYGYWFAWKNNPRRAALFGRRCRIIRTGKLGSVLLEFETGERVVSSRRALRRVGP